MIEIPLFGAWVLVGSYTAVRSLSRYTTWLGYKDWVYYVLAFPTAILWPVWYIVMGQKSYKVNWIVRVLLSPNTDMNSRNFLHDELEAMYRGED